MTTTVTMTGFDAISKIIAGKIRPVGTVSFEVVAGGARGQAKNTLIAKVQQAKRRNPWYLDRDSRDAIRFLTRGMASLDAETVASATKQIGNLLLDSVRANVERMRNPDGSTFKELTVRYAAFKRRKYGFIHPILKATNDLLGGLRVVVNRTT